MKKKKNVIWIILNLCLIFAAIWLPNQKALAASAAMNLSLSREEIMTDSTFSIVLTVESSEEIGSLECFLSFDTEYMQFVSGGAYVTGGEGLVLINDPADDEEAVKKKYSMKFKAIQGGETTVWIGNDVKILCALDDTEMSVSRNQLLFSITDPERISDDTELKGLSVSEGELVPAFKNTVKKYSLKIGADTETIQVKAEPSDEDAAVSVKGNTKLKAGKNRIKITVTAPSGAQDVTTITVNKEEKEVNERKEETFQEEEESIPHTGVKASESEDGSRFLSETLRVQVLSLEDETLLPKDYVKTTLVIDGLPITVYSWKYDLNSDILLVYGMNQEGETGFYEYNRVDNTLGLYQAKAEHTDSTVKKDVLADDKKESHNKQILSMGIAMGVLGIICILLSIALALNLKKAPKEKEEKEDDFFF